MARADEVMPAPETERPTALSPPANVEVAEEVDTMTPNCPTPPSTNEPCRPWVAIPPVKVDVAVEVEVMTPVVRDPVVMLEKMEEMERKMLANREVVVAFVARRLVNVEVAEEVAVITPTVSVPMLEEETSSLTLESSGV